MLWLQTTSGTYTGRMEVVPARMPTTKRVYQGTRFEVQDIRSAVATFDSTAKLSSAVPHNPYIHRAVGLSRQEEQTFDQDEEFYATYRKDNIRHARLERIAGPWRFVFRFDGSSTVVEVGLDAHHQVESVFAVFEDVRKLPSLPAGLAVSAPEAQSSRPSRSSTSWDQWTVRFPAIAATLDAIAGEIQRGIQKQPDFEGELTFRTGITISLRSTAELRGLSLHDVRRIRSARLLLRTIDPQGVDTGLVLTFSRQMRPVVEFEVFGADRAQVEGLTVRVRELLRSEVPGGLPTCRRLLRSLAIVAGPVVGLGLILWLSVARDDAARLVARFGIASVLLVAFLVVVYYGLDQLAPALELLPDSDSRSRWGQFWGAALAVGLAITGGVVAEILRAFLVPWFALGPTIAGGGPRDQRIPSRRSQTDRSAARAVAAACRANAHASARSNSASLSSASRTTGGSRTARWTRAAASRAHSCAVDSSDAYVCMARTQTSSGAGRVRIPSAMPVM